MMHKVAAGCIYALLCIFIDARHFAAADTYSATPSDYVALLRKLAPGDTLVLSPGRYVSGLPVHHLVGTRDHPIVIEGPASPPYAQFAARPDAHTVSIINSAYVEVRNLELDGNDLGVSAVRCEGHADWAHNITLQNLYIHRHGRDQLTTGIASFCPAWRWVIRNNVIIGAGTGMYLGRPDGTAPFVAGVIERNLIVDSIGYNLQIKHQRERPAVTGMPQDKNVTLIRYNVFSKSANSSGGNLARPNLLVGHWPPAGPGVEDSYAIYGNFFFQNPSEALFQGEGNFAFYSNVMVNSYGNAIHVQPHNALPRRIDIFRNTILAANTGIRLIGGDPAFGQRVIGNAVFAQVAIAGGGQLANATGSVADAQTHLRDPNSPPGKLDLAPRPGKLAMAPFKYQPQNTVPEFELDFDGRAYTHPVAGVYAGDGAIRRLLVEPRR